FPDVIIFFLFDDFIIYSSYGHVVFIYFNIYVFFIYAGKFRQYYIFIFCLLDIGPESIYSSIHKAKPAKAVEKVIEKILQICQAPIYQSSISTMKRNQVKHYQTTSIYFYFQVNYK